MEWLAKYSTATLVEAPRRPLAPDLHDLGPYSLDIFEPFQFLSELHCESFSITEPPRPLLVASNQGLLVGSTWRPPTEFTALSGGRDNRNRGVETFHHRNGVFKVERASADYFERCQALNEATFLQMIPTETRLHLDLPAVQALWRGRAVTHVFRENVPGRPLTPGVGRDDPALIQEFVNACGKLGGCGLFHNDLRPWNLLWDGDRVRFIDFADTSTEDLDVQDLPQILAFAGTLAGLIGNDLPWGEDFLAAVWAAFYASGALDRYSLDSLRGAPWIRLEYSNEFLATSWSGLADAPPSLIIAVVIDALMSGVGP